MPLCLETICVRNRQLQNLWAHNDRFNRTRQALWQLNEPARLEDLVQLPDWLCANQTYKCRVTYGPAVQNVAFEPYHVRPVRTLKLLDVSNLDYSHKYADRQPLLELFAQRGTADDVLLVRDGLLTDTTYANVALFDGTRWLTPARPLLAGTMRASLLREGIVQTADLRVEDLTQFSELRMINAMLRWGQEPAIAVEHVKWVY